MKVIIFENLDKLYAYASDAVTTLVKGNKQAVLGLATGRTPERLYELMILDFVANNTDYSRVMTFNLDEYVGLSQNHHGSYRFYMNSKLFDKINIDKKNTHILDGMASNLQEECKRFDKLLDDNVRDLQLLGLGANGHIGFNEPTINPIMNTHIVPLTQSTILANAEFFGGAENVPKQALTMGIGAILDAKKILLIATGGAKADALLATLQNKDERVCPAVALNRHSNTIILCDKEASKLLKGKYENADIEYCV